MELIEREESLALLHDGFQKASEGEGHSIFILGEAGIGKTTLVRTFLEKIEDDCIQYIGACDSLFAPRPLAPLYDLAVQINHEWVEKIESIASRTELFTKYVQELTGRMRSVVVVFEDIHWADEATLDFVKFFARRISRTKCLFILTCRENEINAQHPLRNVLGDLAPDTFTRLQLGPLSLEAVRKLANEKGYDAENLYSISGGNPFYVTEILASNSPGIPDNIKDAILFVYNRLDEATQSALQVLSVMPEGLELEHLDKIDSSLENVIAECLSKRILIIKNNKLLFKHELYRRTIETSLSPFRRINLNKNILNRFLEIFEEKGEVERIVHYAKNANEYKLVVQYAPLAAKQAATVGAHIEAAKLFLTAIEFSDGKDKNQMVKFYEDYTYECYLTNQMKDAIIYQGKALSIWQQKNDVEQIGNSMRFLSRLWWFEGNREKAEKYGSQAIKLLESQPSSKAKAMAFSNMSQLKMLCEESAGTITWGNRAIEIAREINDDEVLCHALNNVGTVLSLKDSGKDLIKESLDLALKNSFHEHAARAYTNLTSRSIGSHQYEFARTILKEGMNYCEERDLHSWTRYMLSWKARLHLETGDWDQAFSIASAVLQYPISPIIKIGALYISAIISIRRGKDSIDFLKEAKSLAFVAGEHQRIIPVMNCLLEYEWLTGRPIVTEQEIKRSVDIAEKVNDQTSLNSQFEYWLEKARNIKMQLPGSFEPYQLLKAGKINQAAGFWRSLSNPYEEGLALFEGKEENKRMAITMMQNLGALAVCEKMKMEMRSSGIKKIPRGIRESTKTNPAQLTNRELDVLQLLKNGVQNKEIAESLYISPKTVDHHISSILFKLNVKSRTKAVHEAIRLGILK